MSDAEVRSAISDGLSAARRWIATSSPVRLTAGVILVSAVIIGAATVAANDRYENNGSVVALNGVPELEILPVEPPATGRGEGAEIALPTGADVTTSTAPRPTAVRVVTTPVPAAPVPATASPTTAPPIPTAAPGPAPTALATTVPPETEPPTTLAPETVPLDTTLPSDTTTTTATTTTTTEPSTTSTTTTATTTDPPTTTTTTTTTTDPPTTTTTSIPKSCIKKGRRHGPGQIDWACVADRLDGG